MAEGLPAPAPQTVEARNQASLGADQLAAWAVQTGNTPNMPQATGLDLITAAKPGAEAQATAERQGRLGRMGRAIGRGALRGPLGITDGAIAGAVNLRHAPGLAKDAWRLHRDKKFLNRAERFGMSRDATKPIELGYKERTMPTGDTIREARKAATDLAKSKAHKGVGRLAGVAARATAAVANKAAKSANNAKTRAENREISAGNRKEVRLPASKVITGAVEK